MTLKGIGHESGGGTPKPIRPLLADLSKWHTLHPLRQPLNIKSKQKATQQRAYGDGVAIEMAVGSEWPPLEQSESEVQGKNTRRWAGRMI